MAQSIFNTLLFFLFFIWLHLLIFLKNKMNRLLTLNLLPVVILTIPLYLHFQGIQTEFAPILMYLGLVVFPYTLAYLILVFFPLIRKGCLKKLLLFILFFIPLLIFFKEQRNNIIQIMHIIIYGGIILRIYKKITMKFHIIAIPILSIVSLSWNLAMNHGIIYTLLIVMAQYVFTYLAIVLEFSKSFHTLDNRISNIIDQNTILDQRIARLHENNEQLRRIIAQKDTELQQLSRHASLAEITTGIAHELAQPLTGIKGVSQNMIDDIQYEEFDENQAKEDLDRIVRLVDRSSSIIDHIRTFSRKRGYSFRPVDITVCMLNALELLREQMKKNDIEIDFSPDYSLPKVMGDNIALEQVFINIITNAKDAILQRKINEDIQGKIIITANKIDQHVRLIIEDNGGGIPTQLLPKIWTPFFTTKNKGKGTGIGLSLSRKILSQHKATVSIETEKDSTSFTMLFPIDPRELNDGNDREREV